MNNISPRHSLPPTPHMHRKSLKLPRPKPISKHIPNLPNLLAHRAWRQQPDPHTIQTPPFDRSHSAHPDPPSATPPHTNRNTLVQLYPAQRLPERIENPFPQEAIVHRSDQRNE